MGDFQYSVHMADAETSRLEALDRLRILDTDPEKEFDDLVSLAATICGAPAAALSLVDAHRQWFKASLGLSVKETSRDDAICATTITEPDRVMVVPDLLQDQRFREYSYVQRGPCFRFYAGTPIVVEENVPIGTICILDVRPRSLQPKQVEALQTLARHASALLRQRAQRLDWARRSVAAHLPLYFAEQVALLGRDLTSYVDRDYVYRFVNQTYLEYWATTPEKVIGYSVRDLVGDAFFAGKAKGMLDRSFRGESTEFEATVTFPQMGPRRMKIQHLPAHDAQGRVIGVIVRASDIHRQWEQQAQLSETVALLERQTLNQQRFIHMLSHDLREPVNTISNFAGLIAAKEDPLSPDEREQGLHFILSSAQRMRELINDLLHWMRLDESQVRSSDLSHEIFSLNAVMDDIQTDLSCAIQAAGVELRAETLGFAVGNRTLLRVLLQNLVGNAMKFVAAGKVPRVWVWREERADEIAIRVRDNGIGIPAEEIRRLFEPFRRLHNRRQYPGSGLGLSICRRIAELHQGRIEVESKLNEGSTFSVILPRLSAGNPPAPAPVGLPRFAGGWGDQSVVAPRSTDQKIKDL